MLQVQEEAVDGVSGKDVETMGLFDLRSTGRRVGYAITVYKNSTLR